MIFRKIKYLSRNKELRWCPSKCAVMLKKEIEDAAAFRVSDWVRNREEEEDEKFCSDFQDTKKERKKDERNQVCHLKVKRLRVCHSSSLRQIKHKKKKKLVACHWDLKKKKVSEEDAINKNRKKEN